MQTASSKPLTIDASRAASSLWIFAALAMALPLFALAIFRVPLYRSLIIEDGLVENGSVYFWAAAAVGIAWWGRKNKNLRGAWPIALVLLLAFVACGGEEISWGQRIFHFHTPSELEHLNKQDEFNLHDIGSISGFSNLFFVLTSAFFLLPLSARLRSRFSLLKLVSPVATKAYLLTLFFWILIGLRFGTLGFSPLSLWGYYTQMDDEFYEFFAAYCFAAFAWLAPSFEVVRGDGGSP